VEKEIIINANGAEVEIAIVENGKLVEIHNQKNDTQFSVGDIYLGKIRRLHIINNAAFVDIGHEKDAFLHYTDMGPKVRSLLKYTQGVMDGSIATHKLDNFEIEEDTHKSGRVDQIFGKRNIIMVQVLKEPISSKGPKLSCEITIPGRFLVLVPFTNGVTVSKKIESGDERKRLKNLIESIKPKNFAVIVRTAAEGKKAAELAEELDLMMNKWEEVFKQLKSKQDAPIKLLAELDKASSILRDLVNDSFSKIVINDKDLYNNVKNYLSSFAPEMSKIVHIHGTNQRHIFDAYNINRQIKSSFGKNTTLSSGAYIIMESTEALHVVDVNSGHKASSSDQDAAVFAINMEAAEEIARQLRLRDLGGIIIVDFIDMKNPDHKKDLFKAMRDLMENDRAQHTILPLTKFGLMQITRQRVRPEIIINTMEACPTCEGTGKISPSVLVNDDVQRDLEFILQSHPKGKLHIEVHPYLEAFLKRGFPSIRMRWFFKYNRLIGIKANQNFPINKYTFFDANMDEIRLNA
jgi:ribonuclease G